MIYFTIRLTNTISYLFPVARTHNPLLLAVVYFISFAAPHLIYKYFEIKETAT